MPKENETERKVKSVQKYTFEIIHYEDGHSVMNRINEGFSVIEMLGVASIMQSNLLKILEGAVSPTDEVNVTSSNSPLIHQPEPEPLA